MTNPPRRQQCRWRHRWRKMKKHETAETEALLQLHEPWCMNAYSRYLKRDPAKDNVWLLCGGASVGDLHAVMVQMNQCLLPVISGQKNIPPPHFLRGIFGATVHSVQGRKEDAVVLETVLEKFGLFASENIDYDTMRIDRPPTGFHSSGPGNLVLRKPEIADMEALAALHAAYEREEVLPAKSEFRADISRLNTERIFRNEQVLVAELDGLVIGKINTNAVTLSRCQIGGVYVHPDYRGRGIARKMTGEFASSLVSGGKGVSLFVKKNNPAARNIYLSIGFEITGE